VTGRPDRVPWPIALIIPRWAALHARSANDSFYPGGFEGFGNDSYKYQHMDNPDNYQRILERAGNGW